MKVDPTVPVAVVALETTGAGGTIVIVTDLLPVPLKLVAYTVEVEVPIEVGIPLITPVAVLTDNPDGRPVAA